VQPLRLKMKKEKKEKKGKKGKEKKKKAKERQKKDRQKTEERGEERRGEERGEERNQRTEVHEKVGLRFRIMLIVEVLPEYVIRSRISNQVYQVTGLVDWNEVTIVGQL